MEKGRSVSRDNRLRRELLATCWGAECLDDLLIRGIRQKAHGPVTHQKVGAVPVRWPPEAIRVAVDAEGRIADIGGMPPRA